MIYKKDNRFKRHTSRNIAIDVILGVGITIAGLYFYGNYRVISNPNENSNPTVSQLIQTSNAPNQQSLAQQEEETTNSAQLQARQDAAQLGQLEQQKQAVEGSQQKAEVQDYDQRSGISSNPHPTLSNP